MEEKISDVLKRAKDVLLSRGWYQGDYVNSVTGEVCIMGALNVAERGAPCSDRDDEDDDDTEIGDFLHGVAKLFWYRDVGSWNDAKGRTPEEVLSFMDCAIARAEVRESRQADDAVGLSDDQPVAVHARS